jgi:probable rRNA maturation factor
MNTTIIISIDDHISHSEFQQDEIIALIDQCCQVMNESDAEISVSIITDEVMQELNHQYRGLNKPTDVLSFSMRDGEQIGDLNALGDLVISYDTAVRQAQEFEHSIQIEMNELIFHGMMHLFGYDHECDLEGWRVKEQELIQSLKKNNSAYIPIGMCGISAHNIQH